MKHSILLLSLLLAACTAPPPSPTPPPSTATHTLAPTATPTPTVTPSPALTPEATATMAPIPVVSEFITGVKSVTSYTFNNDAKGVSYPSDSVHRMSDGTMRIDGLQTWGSNLSFDTAIQPGQAVVVDFKSGDTSVVFLDVGNFGDPAYRRVGFNVKGGKLLDDTFRGSTYDMSPLSGTLGTVKPDTWYKAMFAVSRDGTVRMVIWDPKDPTKRVVREVVNPEIAGKSMKLTAGAFSGALIIDEADVFAFDSLVKLPETPVPVLPTAQPTAKPTVAAQPTPGGQPDKPTPQPAGGYNFQLEGNQYICRKCPFTPNLASNSNILQITLTIADNRTKEVQTFDSISAADFFNLVTTYKKQGYAELNMTIYQATSIGDPAVVGMKPQSVWYFMTR